VQELQRRLVPSRWTRSLVISGDALWVLLFDGVRSHAGFIAAPAIVIIIPHSDSVASHSILICPRGSH
jgi:hypothetical protein